MSYPTSQVNRSTESGSSSLQRSGLNISVGDTKSIVLALQALQQKIRALERDRDYHQDQYERSLQANESYKLEMEKQMEIERAQYRRREEDLRKQLQNALAEKQRLEMEAGNEDLSQFRKELEDMIAEEKQHAIQRESKLKAEVERLHNEMEQERLNHKQLVENNRRLKNEREEAYRTNENLRQALNELLSREEMRYAENKNEVKPRARGHSGKGTRASPKRSHSEHKSPYARHMSRASYRDPTVNSFLRDVRNVSGEYPCTHLTAGVDASFAPTAHKANSSSSPTSRNNSVLRTRPAKVPETSRRVQGEVGPDTKNKEAVKEVESQIRQELEDLQIQYRHTLQRSASENLPEDVVTAALTRITSLIKNKQQQLELLGSAVAQSESAVENVQSLAMDKAAKRNMIVNELREMLAQSANV